MTYSIVIPTYNKCNELLKPCLESIFTYTSPDVEVIVVANGCTDNTQEYVQLQQKSYPNLRLLCNSKPMGYTKATNWGIQESTGDYVILLNNDTVLLPQANNQWIDILVKPFLEDLSVGMTGPFMNYCPYAKRDFLIFFCVMIKRQMFHKLGILDEIFSPGYGEDTDFGCRIVDAGYKIVQVPDNSRDYYGVNRRTGQFPIYHEGNVTFRDLKDNGKVLEKNNLILQDRYDKSILKIEKALSVDGFMSDLELSWIAKQAKIFPVVIEVGSWKGRSTRSWGDNSCGKVYAIDHWKGTEDERETFHIEVKEMNGDKIYFTFLSNNYDLIENGKVLPIRMDSINAAKFLTDKGIQADMIFIDGGHTYEEVKKDIDIWLPLVKETGFIAGHDYFHEHHWPGVKQAVTERFKEDIYVEPNTSIWIHKKREIDSYKPKIYDCFPFFNELDLLEIRFNELYDTVDYFVISEATKTHGNKTKPLYFKLNEERFKKFLDKVIYIVVDDFPALDSWSIERHQREALSKGLVNCNDNDIIITGDADEIPRAEALKQYNPKVGMACLRMHMHYYYLNCRSQIPWDWTRILTFKLLKTIGHCQARYTPNYMPENLIDNAGWHFSFIGGTEKIIEKIEATAHQEYNIPQYKNKEAIIQMVEDGEDIFFREGIKYDYVDIGDGYPIFVKENIENYRINNLIKTNYASRVF
jgi:beta-1,4-mannosyl-glycoprotein beta-1,4-N-acetylglucosaminyltransferase